MLRSPERVYSIFVVFNDRVDVLSATAFGEDGCPNDPVEDIRVGSLRMVKITESCPDGRIREHGLVEENVRNLLETLNVALQRREILYQVTPNPL